MSVDEIVWCRCVFIPFTYSIFNGVTFGFGIYIILYVLTGDLSGSDSYWQRLSSSLRKAGQRLCCCCCYCCRCCCCYGGGSDEGNSKNFEEADRAGAATATGGKSKADALEDDGSGSDSDSDTFNDVAIIGSALVMGAENDGDAPATSPALSSARVFKRGRRDSKSVADRLNVELHQRLHLPRASYTPPAADAVVGPFASAAATSAADEGVQEEEEGEFFAPAKLREARYTHPSAVSGTGVRGGAAALPATHTGEAQVRGWGFFSFLRDTQSDKPRRHFNAGAGALLLGTAASETPDWVLD